MHKCSFVASVNPFLKTLLLKCCQDNWKMKVLEHVNKDIIYSASKIFNITIVFSSILFTFNKHFCKINVFTVLQAHIQKQNT